MAEWARGDGVEIVAVAPIRDAQGQRYAASTVRALLQSGQAQAAAEILGRPFTMHGVVAHGDKRGRQFGFPTANIDLGDYLRPQYGVYAVRARRAGDAGWLDGVANIGRRPTLDGAREWLEAHLFDFSAEIYGELWEIALADFIRPEMKFTDTDQLKAAIERDIGQARGYWGKR